MIQLALENNFSPQVFSFRGGENMGEHIFELENSGEKLSITHTAKDRTIFASGAIRACEFAQNKKAGLYNEGDIYL